MNIRNLQHKLSILGGCACVVLAFIGALVPILPTRPFPLLAAYLFTRSSPGALDWLENNRIFGHYLRNYRQGRGLALHEKVVSIGLLWLTIGISVVSMVDHAWIQIGLLAVAIGVTRHLVRMNTCRSKV